MEFCSINACSLITNCWKIMKIDQQNIKIFSTTICNFRNDDIVCGLFRNSLNWSIKTLASNLNVCEEEAASYIRSYYEEFPDLEKFIKENSEYPMKNNGYIKTELGDVLRCPDYRYLYKPDPYRKGSYRVDNRIVSKLNSAGINYRIQSFSAIALASGFEHVIQKALEENKLIRNIIVVHK